MPPPLSPLCLSPTTVVETIGFWSLGFALDIRAIACYRLGSLILYAHSNDEGKIHVSTSEKLGQDEWSGFVESEHVIHKHQVSRTISMLMEYLFHKDI